MRKEGFEEQESELAQWSTSSSPLLSSRKSRSWAERAPKGLTSVNSINSKKKNVIPRREVTANVLYEA